MYCVYCGAYNDDSRTICAKCDGPLPEPSGPPGIAPAWTRPKPMSKRLHMSVAIGALCAFLVAPYLFHAPVSRGQNSLFDPRLGLVLLGILVYYVFYLIQIYKFWAAIQDGRARTTPGRAIGYQFIPIFNIYWIFQAVYGLAKDFNAYLDRHDIDGPRFSTSLLLNYCILDVLCLIPRLGYMGFLLDILSFGVWTTAILPMGIDAVNHLADLPEPESARTY